MSFLSRIMNRPAQVSLVREGQKFFLKFYYDGAAASCAEIVERWPELKSLAYFVRDAGASSCEISPAALDALRAGLRKLREQSGQQRKLSIGLSPEVERVEVRTKAPEGFAVRYLRAGNSLLRSFPADTVELEGGWFRQGDAYWRFERLSEQQLATLRRRRIDGSELVPFLSQELPALRAAGISIQCELDYLAEPAVELQLRSLSPTRIELTPLWRVPPNEIDASFTPPGYVLARNALRPGLTPAALRAVTPDIERPIVLEDERAAYFLDTQYPQWKRLATGDTGAFEAEQRWVEPPFRWILVARARETRGIGRASATPFAQIGGEEFSSEQVAEMLRHPYTRIQAGWVRARDLRGMGIDEAALKPIRLDADLLLHRGGKRIDGPYSKMRLEGAPWLDRGDKHSCINGHLAFLMHWGVNGGVVGGYEAMVAYGLPLLLNFCRAHPDATALVLGSREDCRALVGLSPIFGGLFNGSRARLIPYDALTAGQNNALGTRYDLAMLIEPDAREISASVALLQAVASVRAACKIAFVLQETPALSRTATLLGLRNAADARLLIRDGRRPEPLYEPYQFSATQAPKAASAPDIVEAAPKRERSRGIPIPSRDAPVKAFFLEARRLADFAGNEAPRVSFNCAQPKYSNMNPAQRNWYFWLRAQLRRGEYPQTDTSYLYVYIYELLNGIGTQSPAQGLDALIQLWRHYGELDSQLALSLEIWVFDYARVYGVELSAGDLLWRVPGLTDLDLNVLLTELAEGERALRLPVWALERLSQYAITGSKFYQRGNQAIMDRVLPDVVEAVDQSMRAKGGKGILNSYAALKLRTEAATAFNGALTESPRRYAMRLRNYTGGQKLQNFLKNLVRYAENALRARLKFGSRLQGVELTEQVRGWADACLSAMLDGPAEASAAPARIVLDPESIARLRAESNQVRAALLASLEDAETQSSPPPENAPGLSQSSDGSRPGDAKYEPEDVPETTQPRDDSPRPMPASQPLFAEQLPEGEPEPPQAREYSQRPIPASQSLFAEQLSDDEPELPQAREYSQRPMNTSQPLIEEQLPEGEPELPRAREYSQRPMNTSQPLIEEQLPGDVPELSQSREYSQRPMNAANAPGAEDVAKVPVRAELSGDVGGTVAPFSGSDADESGWNAFFEQLRAHGRLDALAALAEGSERFQAFAHSRGEMAELLLDSLNELAADTIGDLIADESGPFEDYLPTIRERLSKE